MKPGLSVTYHMYICMHIYWYWFPSNFNCCNSRISVNSAHLYTVLKHFFSLTGTLTLIAVHDDDTVCLSLYLKKNQIPVLCKDDNLYKLVIFFMHLTLLAVLVTSLCPENTWRRGIGNIVTIWLGEWRVLAYYSRVQPTAPLRLL